MALLARARTSDSRSEQQKGIAPRPRAVSRLFSAPSGAERREQNVPDLRYICDRSTLRVKPRTK